jgi:hypothetical protein
MVTKLFLDFFGDNPFAELDLPYPPVPRETEVKQAVTNRITERNNRLRKLDGRSGEKVREETEKLQKELEELKVLRKKVVIKVKELATALPFDTLLAVQSIAPRVYFHTPARAAVIAQAWSDLAGNNGAVLSETRRTNFEKDFKQNALLDEIEAAGDEVAEEKGEDNDV